MSLPEIRFQYRTHLSEPSRGVDVDTVLHPSLHPSEKLERLWLRLLAWALWYTPGLRFGPGLSSPDEPSLFDTDPTGRRSVYVAVDPPDAERLAFAARHNQDAVVAAAFGGEAALVGCIANSRTHRGTGEVEVAVVEERLLAELAERFAERRYDLAITLLDESLYLDVGGEPASGSVKRWQGLKPYWALGARP